jgi:hypothetical protein
MAKASGTTMSQKRPASGPAAAGMLRDAKDASRVRETLFVMKIVCGAQRPNTPTGAAAPPDWRSCCVAIDGAAAGERRRADGLPGAADAGGPARVAGAHASV